MILLVIILIRILSPEFITGNSLTLTATTVSNEWTCVSETENIKLYERWIKVNDSLYVRERKGEMIVSCPLMAAEVYMRNHKTLTEWMRGIKSIKDLSEDSTQLVHIIIQLPWPFQNRDLIGLYQYYKIDQNKSTIQLASNENAANVKSKYVRIKHYRATWSLERINDNTTKIVLNTYSTEPPLFPEWIQEPVIRRIFTSNLLRLKKRLSEV